MTRRDFLLRSSAAAAVLGGVGVLAVEARRAPCADGEGEFGQRIPDELWDTLAAVQGRLLPSGPGSPGAREVRATAYLDAMLAESGRDPSDCALVGFGLRKLEIDARLGHGRDFTDLAPRLQNHLLIELERTADGPAWFELVLGGTLEAFLGDPVYGSNVNGMGWKLLQHRPGWPRPVRPGLHVKS